MNAVFRLSRSIVRTPTTRAFHKSRCEFLPVLSVPQHSCIRRQVHTSMIRLMDEVSYEDLKTLIQANSAYVIDVREASEIDSQGKLPDALNIPFGHLKEALSMTEETFFDTYKQKKPDKFSPSLIFSALGPIKSKAALELAMKQGYFKARHYGGGFNDWDRRQMGLHSDTYYPSNYLIEKFDLTYEEIKSLLLSKSIVIIDVRELEDIENEGEFPLSIHIPLGDLKEALLMSATDFKARYNAAKPLKHDAGLVFCGLGCIKSSAALKLAHKLGFARSRHYSKGWEEWSKLEK